MNQYEQTISDTLISGHSDLALSVNHLWIESDLTHPASLAGPATDVRDNIFDQMKTLSPLWQSGTQFTLRSFKPHIDMDNVRNADAVSLQTLQAFAFKSFMQRTYSNKDKQFEYLTRMNDIKSLDTVIERDFCSIIEDVVGGDPLMTYNILRSPWYNRGGMRASAGFKFFGRNTTPAIKLLCRNMRRVLYRDPFISFMTFRDITMGDAPKKGVPWQVMDSGGISTFGRMVSPWRPSEVHRLRSDLIDRLTLQVPWEQQAYGSMQAQMRDAFRPERAFIMLGYWAATHFMQPLLTRPTSARTGPAGAELWGMRPTQKLSAMSNNTQAAPVAHRLLDMFKWARERRGVYTTSNFNPDMSVLGTMLMDQLTCRGRSVSVLNPPMRRAWTMAKRGVMTVPHTALRQPFGGSTYKALTEMGTVDIWSEVVRLAFVTALGTAHQTPELPGMTQPTAEQVMEMSA